MYKTGTMILLEQKMKGITCFILYEMSKLKEM